MGCGSGAHRAVEVDPWGVEVGPIGLWKWIHRVWKWGP